MRIAVLTNEYEPDIVGGLGTVSTRLAESMAARGHEVIVLTKWAGKTVTDQSQQGVRVIRFPRNSRYQSMRSHVFYAEPVMQYVKSRISSLDAVHIHSLQADQVLASLCKEYGARSLYTCHSLIAHEGRSSASSNRMESRQISVMQQVTTIVTPSRWEKRMIQHLYKNLTTPIRVIPNGVKTERVHTSHPKGRLLYAGRVIRSKGIEELLHALALARRQYKYLRLDIRGAGSPMYLNRLQVLSRNLHIRHHVHLLGKCDHQTLQRSMGEYSAVVVPSRTESFGLVALEAMAAGTPLISTRVGGLSDFVDAHVATIIESGTPEAIASAIRRMLRDRRATEKRRKRALARARSYSWSHVTERYVELITELAGI